VQLGGGKLGRRAPKVLDRAKVPVPPYYPDIPEVREEIAHHYDCLLKTDEQVGQVIAALKRDGHYGNTVIFLFSDHGYKLHRHKQFLYEGGIHMPLIVVGPKLPPAKCATIWSVGLMYLPRHWLPRASAYPPPWKVETSWPPIIGNVTTSLPPATAVTIPSRRSGP